MMVGVHVGMSRRRTGSGPVAPAGSFFATAAHPSTTRNGATFGTSIPCIDGADIRWWQDLVSGTWHEQASSGARLILRASGGSWYAEGGTGRSHVFTIPTWSGGTNATVCSRFRSQIAGSVNLLPAVCNDGEYYSYGDNRAYAQNFRTTRLDYYFGVPANTAWRTYSQVSGADYRAYLNGSQMGTTAAADWSAPSVFLINLSHITGGATGRVDFVSSALYASATSRAAGETWAESFGL